MNDALIARLERALDKLERSINPGAVYTADEAAALLCTTRNQVYAYIRSGRLSAFHLERNGQKWLTTGRDIENLIATLKRESA
jgi:hypothetical protein